MLVAPKPDGGWTGGPKAEVEPDWFCPVAPNADVAPNAEGAAAAPNDEVPNPV